MKKSLISLLVGLSLGSSFAANAADEERWFEVEVILFERNIDPAKVIEHWDQSAYPTYSPKNKDPMALFINDDNLITPNGSNNLTLINDNNVATGQQPTIIDDSQTLPVFGTDQEASLEPGINTNIDIIKTTNVVIDGANLKSDAKDPSLQIVPASELQLTEQFTALNEHANYNVVLHSAWRMQPQDRNAAIPIRLFAGQNYQQQYKQNGDARVRKIVPVVSAINAVNQADQLSESIGHIVGDENVIDLDNTATINDGASVSTTKEQVGDTETTALLTEAAPDSPPIPVTPVWKIDGELTIYLEHYLYAKTNLFVRKEGTKTITSEEIIAADLEASHKGTNVENIDLLALLGIHLEPKKTQHNEATLSNSDVKLDPVTEDFLIEDIDTASTDGDDVLTDDKGNVLNATNTNAAQDKTLPFLNSYPMQQLRVIRSGEIHYLDHPMFGMLIQIRKYEPPMTEGQE